MKIEMRPVDKQVPYPKNARKITDQAVEKVFTGNVAHLEDGRTLAQLESKFQKG